MWFSVIAAIVIVAGWYWFEGSWDRKLFRAEPGTECGNLNARAAAEFLQSHPRTQVLDVRSAAEFGGGALPGAMHISIGDPAFSEKLQNLDRDRPVLVYCAGGYRSRKAVPVLKELGFRSIQHIHRGYHSWQFAGQPVEKHATEP
jgi:rhodanese-related sulfurtransferase